jgi:hypothetical protein
LSAALFAQMPARAAWSAIALPVAIAILILTRPTRLLLDADHDEVRVQRPLLPFGSRVERRPLSDIVALEIQHGSVNVPGDVEGIRFSADRLVWQLRDGTRVELDPMNHALHRRAVRAVNSFLEQRSSERGASRA